MNKNNLEETRELNKQSAANKDRANSMSTSNVINSSFEKSNQLKKPDDKVISGLSKAATSCMSSSSKDAALQEKR